MTKPLILAIEPDARQAGQLQAIARRLSADMQLVKSTERALATFDKAVPDLILTPPLLSRRDELALTERLRSLGEAGAHIQTLTIPILEASDGPSRGSGMLSALRRDRTRVAGPAACQVDTFAEQVSIYLERAVTIRRIKEIGASAAAAAATAETSASVETPEPAAPVPDEQVPIAASTIDGPFTASAEPVPVDASAGPARAQPEPPGAHRVVEADEPAPIVPPDAVAPPRQVERVRIESLPSPAPIALPDAPAPLRQVERVKVEALPPPAPIAPGVPASPRQLERVKVETLPSPQAVIEGPEPDFLMTIRQLKSTLTSSVRELYSPRPVPESEPVPQLQSLVEPEAPAIEADSDPVTMSGFDAAPDGLAAYLSEAAAFSAETDAVELAPVEPPDPGDADIGALGDFAKEADLTVHVPAAVADLASLFAPEPVLTEPPPPAATPPEKPHAEAPSLPVNTAPPLDSDRVKKRRKKGSQPEEWQYFDPKQFRFAALLAKLDEITDEKRG